MPKIVSYSLAGILIMVGSAYGRTRADVVADAAAYHSLSWTPTGDNILDVENHFAVLGTTLTPPSGKDEIDDRGFERNNETNVWKYSPSNWPFVVGSTVTGEAYAFGMDHNTVAFASYLPTRIAGSRQSDVDTDGDNIVDNFDLFSRITGIDCSGFVQQAYGLPRRPVPYPPGTEKYNVATLKAISQPVPLKDLKPGDIFASGGHVLLFTGWDDKYRTAHVRHAVPFSYSENVHERRVIYEVVDVSSSSTGAVKLYNANVGSMVLHEAKSVFPQFAWKTPREDWPFLNPLAETVELTITSKMDLLPASIILVLDGDLATATTIQMSATGYTLTPAAEASTITVRYAFQPDFTLAPGTHTLTAYAGNTLGLQDLSRVEFDVIADSRPPRIAWEDGGVARIFGDLTGANTLGTAPWMHTEQVRFQVDTDKNPLISYAAYLDDSMSVLLSSRSFVEGTGSAVLGDALTGFPDRTGYYALASDALGNTTTMYFHLDKVGPVIETTVTVKLNAAGDGFSYDAAGRALDAMSGIGDDISLTPLEGETTAEYLGPAWPPGPGEAGFSFEGIESSARFLAFDRAGWPGMYDLMINSFTQELLLNATSYMLDAAVYSDAGAILRDPSLTVSGYYPDLPPDVTLLDQPTGFKTELIAEPAPPLPDMESDVLLEYAYSPGSRAVLFTIYGISGFESGGPNRAMRPGVSVRLALTGNTNTVRYTYPVDTDDDGIPDVTAEGEFPPGYFKPRAIARGKVETAYLSKMEWLNKWLPAGDVQEVVAGNVGLRLFNVTKPGSLLIAPSRLTLEAAGYKMAGDDVVYELKTTAEYDGPAEVSVHFGRPEHDDAQLAGGLIWHRHSNEDEWAPVSASTTPTAGRVVATVPALSQFAVLVPVSDTTPPYTRLETIGVSDELDGRLWVTPATYVDVIAEDYAQRGDISGVATTYMLIDEDPSPECLGSPRDGGAPAGSCANPFFGGAFALAEGSHTLHFMSADNWGNQEEPWSRVMMADGTPPYSSLMVNGSTVPAGAALKITAVDYLSLTGDDPVSNGVASGLLALVYLVDTDWGSCPDGEPAFTGPPGTCDNPVYEGPFTLSEGSHTVYYGARDSIMNQAPLKPVYFTVVSTAAAGALILPSSGPIGLPFTITGEGFGTYSAGTTVVLIGGAAAPLTLWSTDTIKGTVPGSLAAGEYPVVVLRGEELLAETSSFTVVIPALAEIAPSSGPIGLPFTLTGAGFGNYLANYTRVLISGATCPLTLWTDTQIKGTIPGTIAPGAHEVLVERELNGGLARSGSLSFDLRDMEADWIAPSSGPLGMPFTINGAGFGNYLANYTTVLMGGTTCPLTLWTDSQIKGTVPGGLATGQYPVLVERQTADGGVMHSPEMSFTVLAVDASSMMPAAGPIGIPFTIYGMGFGNYSAGWTRVLIGGTTAPLTLWTDSQIKGTIPGVLPAGTHEVVVERELNGGLAASQPLPFTLIVPDLAAVTPSSGPIGLPFTLTGSGFGNYVANSAKVLIGGTTCQLTLWTDSQIKGTVPGTIAPGVHELAVERAFNGGVSLSQALNFELADPVLAAVSPSPAAVLAPFTLEGYSFGNYVAGRSEALIGGATAQLTLWTDTKIQGKLPALGAGEYQVFVRRSFNDGVAQSQSSSMTIVEPSVSSMTPVSGQPGTTFSVFGAGFGPYDAAIARVLIGGLPSALSLWNDGRINGTIPAELAVGTHTVIVSRGQYQADPLEFYVPEGGGYNPSFMAPLSPSAAFRLGEVYVYPNPAKGGAMPIFHLEFGLADKVELKVYSVAGSLVHERTLTGPPQVTSPVYAYEYAWDGHIASGVYYFTVEAERAGSKLKARGKFAVVR